MNSRMKQIRLYFNLSQVEFGKKIGIESRSHISGLENGSRNITDRIINDICREFNVREEWLRNGIGDMFEKMTKEEMVASILGKVFNNNDSELYDFKMSVFRELGKLAEKDWEVIQRLVDGITKE